MRIHTRFSEHSRSFPQNTLCFYLRVSSLPALTFIEWTYCYLFQDGAQEIDAKLAIYSSPVHCTSSSTYC